MPRHEGRNPDQLRPVTFHRNYARNAEGSVLVEVGNTRVICTASAVNGVPRWMRDSGKGWMTAEYAMLPGSVTGRKRRETLKKDGRSVEIQRLIGRALRAVVDMEGFPGITLHVDCDVLQADGGTRCASITGAMVAVHDAFQALAAKEKLSHWPLRDWVAAVSVGVVDETVLLDLDYEEDFAAQVDMNIVATGKGKLIEVQGTAEGDPFSRDILDQLVDSGLAGCAELANLQQEAVLETQPAPS